MLCDPMDYTVYGILQARILEWVDAPFSRGSSQPSEQTQVPHIAGWFLTSWATWQAQHMLATLQIHKACWAVKDTCPSSNGLGWVLKKQFKACWTFNKSILRDQLKVRCLPPPTLFWKHMKICSILLIIQEIISTSLTGHHQKDYEQQCGEEAYTCSDARAALLWTWNSHILVISSTPKSSKKLKKKKKRNYKQ